MTVSFRKLAYGLPVVALLLVAAANVQPAPSRDGAPLIACQETVRTAALKLDSEIQRDVSTCLIRGIECLVGSPDAPQSCCEQAAARCGTDFAKLDEAARRFESTIAGRGCTAAPFSDLLTGLGFGNLEEACGALAPPAPLGNLGELAACLRRLIVSRTACLIGTRELPRGADALACEDFADEFRTATDTDLATCHAQAAPLPCVDGKLAILASLDQPYSAAVIDLHYPASVAIPGAGEAQSVADSVQFQAASFIFTATSDQDRNGDGTEDTLTASLLNLGNNPAGAFALVTFECAGETAAPLSAFNCVLTSASDENGVDTTAGTKCSLTAP